MTPRLGVWLSPTKGILPVLFAKGGNFVGGSERTHGDLARTGAFAVTTALYREIVIIHFFHPQSL
jgi:hypothetical protein